MAHGLRFANKASRIFCVDRRRGNHNHQIVGLSRLPRASNRDLRTIRRTNREGIGHGGIAACRPSKASRNRRPSGRPIKSWLTSRCSRPQSSSGALPRLASGQASAVPTETSSIQRRTASSKRRQSVGMVEIRQVWERENQSPPGRKVRCSQILPPRKSFAEASFRRADAFGDALNRQSIIAALRMHTIVACAGFSLRLRIR